MKGLRKRVAGKAIGLTVLVAVMATGMGTPNALAATQQTEYRPGSVTYYKTVGDSAYNITIPAPYAWRSPATSGPQTVYVLYTVVESGVLGTHTYTQGWFSRSIPAGAQGVWLPAQSWKATAVGGVSYEVASYATGMEVRWYSGTTYLGGRRVIYNQNGDYQCNGTSSIGPCWASDLLTFMF